MPRLGELLVAAGVIAPAQLDEGLRAQVIHGARLGTNLVELGHAELDDIAVALARLHGLPPALRRHFERCDPEVQQRLPPALAARNLIIPIGYLTDSERVMVAVRHPLAPGAVAELEAAMELINGGLVQAVCAELRIQYFLERVYKVPRSNRFLRVRRATRESPAPELDQPPKRHVGRGREEDTWGGGSEAGATGSGGRMVTDGGSYRHFEDTTSRFAAVSSGEIDVDELSAAIEHPTAAPTTGLRGPPKDVGRIADIDLGELSPFEPHDDFHIEETPVEHIIDPPAPGSSWRRPRAPTAPPAGRPAMSLLDDPFADLVPAPIAHPLPMGGEELRRFVETLADPRPTAPTLGRIAIRRVAMKPGTNEISEVGEVGELFSNDASLDEVARTIRRATTRNKVGDLAIGALGRFGGAALGAAILFVVREATAIGWKGFVSDCDQVAIDELAVPLDAPTLLAAAAREGRALMIDGPQGTDIDRRLWDALGVAEPKQIAAAPVLLADHVVCIFYGHAVSMAPFAELFAAVTQATTSAFSRLLRAAQR